MSRREERIARNEAIFRRANERLRGAFGDLAPPDELMPFICECDDARCMRIIELSVAEYEAVRRDAAHFAVVPDHRTGTERDVTDEVVSRSARFAVVEKTTPEAREIVSEDGPH